MTSTKVQRDHDSLRLELIDQISLLETSLISFDQGQFVEGKRIATSLRILLHDTSKSHSLLGKHNLAIKDKMLFFDVAHPYDSRNLLSQDCLLNILAPRLFISPSTPLKAFDEWWNKQIVIATSGASSSTYTRWQIINLLANQDGGAHVDPKLDEEYYEMTRNNKYGWFLSSDKDANTTPLSNDRFKLAARTIAFEVCASLLRIDNTLPFRTIEIRTAQELEENN